jgi:uncharacterized membrane protein
MHVDNDPLGEAPLFSAIMQPHRSLAPRGFLVLMLAIAGASLVAGLAFVLAGAWPVTGLFGVDVALVYFAFRANYRAAHAYEQVMVTPTELVLRRVSARGIVSEWRCNPLWVRLDRREDEDYGVQDLHLVARGERRPIAAFLSPEEKESFGRALQAAIAAAKRGPTRTALA